MDQNKLMLAVFGALCTIAVPMAINAFLQQGRNENQLASQVRESVYQLREVIRDNQSHYDRQLNLLLEELNEVEKSNPVILDRQRQGCPSR